MSDCNWLINDNWRVLGRSFATFKVADKTSRSATEIAVWQFLQ